MADADGHDHALHRLTWPEVSRRLARDGRLLVPVGSLEQHGPHLPLGTSSILAQAVVRELSGRLGILWAPAFPYGVNLPGSDRFAGTAGLRRKTLHRTVNELLAAWEDHGVTEFVLVSAHRAEAHLDALLMALTPGARTTVFDLHAIDVSDLLFDDPGPEHAGELETAVMLHLAPELVVRSATEDAPPDADQLATYSRGRTPTPLLETRGVLGRPGLATPETGAAVFARWIDARAAALGR